MDTTQATNVSPAGIYPVDLLLTKDVLPYHSHVLVNLAVQEAEFLSKWLAAPVRGGRVCVFVVVGFAYIWAVKTTTAKLSN